MYIIVFIQEYTFCDGYPLKTNPLEWTAESSFLASLLPL